jgi:hypothetical protein
MADHTSSIVTPPNLIPGVIDLDEQDDNAMFLIGAVRRALRHAGNSPEVLTAFSEEAMSGDYDHVSPNLRCLLHTRGAMTHVTAPGIRQAQQWARDPTPQQVSEYIAKLERVLTDEINYPRLKPRAWT